VNHTNLGLSSNEEAEKEMMGSKEYLEDAIQHEVDSIAFPDGSYSESTLDLATGCGYSKLLAVNYRLDSDRSDPRILNRFGLYNDRSYIEQLHQVNRHFHAEQ
jgi:peptidoglycan/xylan/chitin deacetylase (PgdA/CDA1 family)